jgi:hypothetical protein
MDVKNMTEEESDMVAEYSAGVLLRYSDTYPWRLVTKEQKASDEQATSAPEATATAQTGDEVSSAEPQPSENTDESLSSADKTDVQNVNLDDIYRLDGIRVKVKKGWFCQKYKNIQASAGSGEKLFVISFELYNHSSSVKKINLMKRDLDYPLTIDGEVYQLGINMLEGNDMKYLNTAIRPGKKKTAVLVYTIPKTAGKSSSEVKLTVSESGNSTQSTQNIDIH